MSETFYCPVCREPMVAASEQTVPFTEVPEANESIRTVVCDCMTCDDVLGVAISIGIHGGKHGT